MSDKTSKTTIAQKVKWLLQHRVFLVGKLDVKKVATAMKRDGLLSRQTYWPDARSGIAEAVRQARLRGNG